MKWITREKVQVDRVARPRLIKQFIDPRAEILFVPAAGSHPSPSRPAGAGLRWVAHGFSALDLSDHEILEREFMVFAAPRAKCQRRIASPSTT